LGPEGTALFYCRAELREQLRLQEYGWHMVERAGDFDRREWSPARSARRFECGSPNMLGIHALQASLSLILEQGVESIGQRILANSQCIIEAVDRRGFELISPRAVPRRSGILTFHVPDRDNQGLQRELMNQGVICACRGGGIRFSPHFHNQAGEIREAFTRLDRLI
jgi:selenocysteine lyase/cysteine desulfurase